MTKSRFFLSSLVLGVGVAGLATAQEPAADSVKGSSVTITGCVATDKENSFVLTHVEGIAGPKAIAPAATTDAMSGLEGGGREGIYWLSDDSVKLMRGHVGHRVEVTGVITEVGTGTLRVKQEPGKSGPDNKVVVEANGKKATAETEAPVVAGAAPTAVKTDSTQRLPVRRVKVDNVKMVALTCP